MLTLILWIVIALVVLALINGLWGAGYGGQRWNYASPLPIVLVVVVVIVLIVLFLHPAGL